MARKKRRNPNDIMNLVVLGGVGFVAWKAGLLNGLLPAQPRTTPVIGAPPPVGAGGTEAQAAQAIWNNDHQMRALYQANHPTWSPLESVRDWWSWAPHEGFADIIAYARGKGWM